MRRACGFTLIELLLVMTIVSALMGLGIGFLTRRSSSLDQAVSVVRDQVRLAREMARNRTSPTQVAFLPGAGGEPPRVQAKVLAAVGQWHFEEETGRGEPGIDGALTGGAQVVDEGRFGRCLRILPEAGKDALRANTQDLAAFDLSQGFRLRVDVFLEAEPGCQVARLGDVFLLQIKPGLLLAADVTLKGEAGRPGRTVHLNARLPLHLHEWITLELGYDLRRVWLLADQKELAGQDEKEELHEDRGASLVLSPGIAPVPGRVDELLLLAYELTEARLLAADVELSGGPPVLCFDPSGEPDSRIHTGPIRFQLKRAGGERTLTLESGGILR